MPLFTEDVVTRYKVDATDYPAKAAAIKSVQQEISTATESSTGGFRRFAAASNSATSALTQMLGVNSRAAYQMQLLNYQGAQAAEALSGVGGAVGMVAGRLASFLPVVAAVGGAVALAVVVYQRLTGATNDAEKATKDAATELKTYGELLDDIRTKTAGGRAQQEAQLRFRDQENDSLQTALGIAIETAAQAGIDLENRKARSAAMDISARLTRAEAGNIGLMAEQAGFGADKVAFLSSAIRLYQERMADAPQASKDATKALADQGQEVYRVAAAYKSIVDMVNAMPQADAVRMFGGAGPETSAQQQAIDASVDARIVAAAAQEDQLAAQRAKRMERERADINKQIDALEAEQEAREAVIVSQTQGAVASTLAAAIEGKSLAAAANALANYAQMQMIASAAQLITSAIPIPFFFRPDALPGLAASVAAWAGVYGIASAVAGGASTGGGTAVGAPAGVGGGTSGTAGPGGNTLAFGGNQGPQERTTVVVVRMDRRAAAQQIRAGEREYREERG